MITVLETPTCGCGRLLPVIDPETGETACGSCGVVLESTEVVPHFNTDHHMRGYRVAHTDIRGDPRMQKLNMRCGGDANGINAQFFIKTGCDKLGLPLSVKTRAISMFAKFRPISKGRRGINDMAAASIYMTCREHSITRTLDEICSAMNANKKKTWHYYHDMYEIVKPTLPSASPIGFVTRIVSNLGLSVNVSKKALEEWESIRGNKLVVGRSPKTLSAYITYVAALDCGENVEPETVADAAGVSYYTLRRTVGLFKNIDEYFENPETRKHLLRPHYRLKDTITKEILEKFYVKDEMSLRQIGAKTGHSCETIRRYLALHGIPIRHRPNLKDTITKEILEKLYVKDGMSIYKIGVKTRHTDGTIRKYMKLHGIPIRPRPKLRFTITKEILENYYVKDGMNVKQIGAKLGHATMTIYKYMKLHGISIRYRPNLKDTITKEILEKIYVKDGMSIDKIGIKMGCSGTTIYNHMVLHGIPIRPRPNLKDTITKKILVKLYVKNRMSINQIGIELGYSYGTIRYYMALHEIPTRPRHNLRNIITKKLLEKLYVKDEMSLRQIGAKTGHSRVTIRRCLVLHGIPIRHRPNLKGTIPKELLEKLYVKDGLNVKRIGIELGYSHATIWHYMALHGIPTRR